MPKPARIQFTKEGYQKVEKDFKDLTQKRKEAVIRLRTAREMGDLSENGAYKAARFELSSIDRELRRLTYLLRLGEVVATQNTGVVDFGRIITLEEGAKRLTFTHVNAYESNPRQEKLSVNSPIGRAILGKRVGDTVTVTAPAGKATYTVVDIN